MQKLITRATPTGVYVVTVRSGEIINGMTAAWVSQVSFKPPMVMVAIAPPRYTHELIQRSGCFCLNALSEKDRELAARFGFKSGRKTDKFKGISYKGALKGSPVLNDAYAYVECEVNSTFEAGDHTLFVGTVVDCEELKEDAVPMIFRWENFFGKKE